MLTMRARCGVWTYIDGMRHTNNNSRTDTDVTTSSATDNLTAYAEANEYSLLRAAAAMRPETWTCDCAPALYSRCAACGEFHDSPVRARILRRYDEVDRHLIAAHVAAEEVRQ